MKAKIVTTIIVLLLTTQAVAGQLQSRAETRHLSDKLVNLFLQEKFQVAADSMKPYWPIPEVEIDGLVNQINQQWPLVRQRFGRGVATEFIGEESIGKSFVRYYYLHKFENHAIYWRINYYRPRSEWKINQVVFLDSLDELYR